MVTAHDFASILEALRFLRDRDKDLAAAGRRLRSSLEPNG